MRIYKNFSIKDLNAFRVSVKAAFFAEVKSEKEIQDVTEKFSSNKILPIGDGSNTLFTNDFNGLVLKVQIKGIKVVKMSKSSVILDVGAGENWHKLVMFSVKKGWSGIENLSYIPGTVGAAPVQNIAAYGQNFGDSAISVTGYNLIKKKKETISAKECRFYYRDSVFKHRLKNKFVITSVRMRLYKTAHFSTNYFGSKPYESLETEIKKLHPGYPNIRVTPEMVAQAVINQRKIKMPDWTKVGTAGSFFKNPFVSKRKFEILRKSIPDLQAYPIDKMLYPHPDDPVFRLRDKLKIPAGKLLDELGWRGKNIGKVGTYERHALIVISQKGASSKNIVEFTKKMQDSVYQKYKIKLESEVNII